MALGQFRAGRAENLSGSCTARSERQTLSSSLIPTLWWEGGDLTAALGVGPRSIDVAPERSDRAARKASRVLCGLHVRVEPRPASEKVRSAMRLATKRVGRGGMQSAAS